MARWNKFSGRLRKAVGFSLIWRSIFFNYACFWFFSFLLQIDILTLNLKVIGKSGLRRVHNQIFRGSRHFLYKKLLVLYFPSLINYFFGVLRVRLLSFSEYFQFSGLLNNSGGVSWSLGIFGGSRWVEAIERKGFSKWLNFFFSFFHFVYSGIFFFLYVFCRLVFFFFFVRLISFLNFLSRFCRVSFSNAYLQSVE
jgi:hypothetical protein